MIPANSPTIGFAVDSANVPVIVYASGGDNIVSVFSDIIPDIGPQGLLGVQNLIDFQRWIQSTGRCKCPLPPRGEQPRPPPAGFQSGSDPSRPSAKEILGNSLRELDDKVQLLCSSQNIATYTIQTS